MSRRYLCGDAQLDALIREMRRGSARLTRIYNRLGSPMPGGPLFCEECGGELGKATTIPGACVCAKAAPGSAEVQ